MTEKMPSPCLDQLQLSKALSLGPNAVEAEHLEACSDCRTQWQALERARVLLRELPTAELPEDRNRILRDAILVQAAVSVERRGPARAWLIASAAIAACLALFVVGRGLLTQSPAHAPMPSAPIMRAALSPHGAVVFTRVAFQPDEVVRISEGTLSLKVRHLNSGERFRVVTSDAEVEVRGTEFEVLAHDNRLVSVRVSEGLVEVRPAGRPIMLVGPGGTWPAQAPPDMQPPPAPPVDPPRPRAPARVSVRRAHAAATPMRAEQPPLPAPDVDGRAAPVDPPPDQQPAAPEGSSVPATNDIVERQFHLGWSALRSDHPEEAARAFAEAASRAGEQPIGEDATFWHAVALERTAHDEAARTALAVFIARYPRSPRLGEASVRLGWLLLENGDKAGASARFSAALSDPVERVRTNAGAGLRAVDRR
jgi:TolA-binding protein